MGRRAGGPGVSAVLALDTSGRSAEVAVADRGALLARVAHDGAGAYAESLLPLVEDALARARHAPAELAAVAVVEGPGSFTGLRIGVMTAKTLCFARGLPLLSTPTLLLLAAAVARGGQQAVPAHVVGLADAGRGHAFLEVFRCTAGEGPISQGAARRIALVDLPGLLVEAPAGTVIGACTPESLGAARAVAAQRKAVVVREVTSLAAELALAASLGEPTARRVDPATLVPTYLSPSQAERARGVDLDAEVHRRAASSPWGGTSRRESS